MHGICLFSSLIVSCQDEAGGGRGDVENFCRDFPFPHFTSVVIFVIVDFFPVPGFIIN